MIYSNQCQICRSQGQRTHYIGESAGSTYERAREHLSGCRGEHIRSTHPEVNYRDREALLKVFHMSVKKPARSPLAIQLGEALAIRRAGISGDTVLNSKEEYSRCYIPLLKVEVNHIK